MKAIKKNGYVVITMIFFVISLSVLVLFLTLFKQSTEVDSTTVGSVYIGAAENENDRREKLSIGVNKWKIKEATYTVYLQGVEIQIGSYPVLDEEGKQKVDKDGNPEYEYKGLEFLTFNYSETINHLVPDEKNLVYYTIDEEKKQEFFATLEDNFGTYICSDLDFERLIADIEKEAREMSSIADFYLYDYLKSLKKTLIISADLENLNEKLIDKMVEKFKDDQIEILPISQTKNKLGFSAIEYFSNEKFSDFQSSDMSIIATGIAAVVQKSSFSVTVKNQGFDTSYAYNYMTARVNPKDGTDLRIINPEDCSYYIQISKIGTGDKAKLHFELHGCWFIYDYTIETKSKTIDPYVSYEKTTTPFVYDPDPNNLMYNVDVKKGCLYRILDEGTQSVLYSYRKIATRTDRDGNIVVVSDAELYPKQEYYPGTDQVRAYTYVSNIDDYPVKVAPAE